MATTGVEPDQAMLDGSMMERLYLARLALPPPPGVTHFVYLLQCYRRASASSRRFAAKVMLEQLGTGMRWEVLMLTSLCHSTAALAFGYYMPSRHHCRAP